MIATRSTGVDAQLAKTCRDAARALGNLCIRHRVVVEHGEHPIAEARRVLIDKSR